MLRHLAYCSALLAVLAVSWAVGQEPTTQPDPNAYPMNAAAVEATPFELKYPPEGEWESADAMLEAHRKLMQELLVGKRITHDEAAKADRRRVADFAAAFVQQFPTHQYTFIMLGNRWRFLGEEVYGSLAPELVQREIDGFFGAGGQLGPGVEELLLGLRIQLAINEAAGEWEQAPEGDEAEASAPEAAEAEALIARYAAEGRTEVAAAGLEALSETLRRHGWKAEADAVRDRMTEKFTESEAALRARRAERLANAPGQPLELSFADIRTGKKVDVQEDLKGKVVLIDFWATWCGPCVGDLPNLRAMHEKYRDQGFEIISVSLDWSPEGGGREALLDFLAENDMPWPQYYQGNGFDSEFSREWGIRAIPTHFIVDANGIIRKADTHRANESEALVVKLLEDRDAAIDR